MSDCGGVLRSPRRALYVQRGYVPSIQLCGVRLGHLEVVSPWFWRERWKYLEKPLSQVCVLCSVTRESPQWGQPDHHTSLIRHARILGYKILE